MLEACFGAAIKRVKVIFSITPVNRYVTWELSTLYFDAKFELFSRFNRAGSRIKPVPFCGYREVRGGD